MSWSSRLVGVVGTVVLLAGCGAGQPTAYPPQGVDALQVPTADPSPGDFVAHVDHPLLALASPARWEYELAEGARTLAVVSREVGAAGEVGGIPVTWVSTRVTSRARSVGDAAWRDAYAQDRAGNVWWFAREGGPDDFAAGEAGALAGVVLTASLRIGDSFADREVPGREAGWTSVVATNQSRDTEVGELEGVVEVAGTSFSGAVDGRTDAEARRWFAPGLGVVLEQRYDGRVLRLVSHHVGE